MNERQDDFKNGDRVFAGLDVDVRNARGPVLDQHLGKLLVMRAKTLQGAVVAAHPAVGAVFAAEVGNLDHGPHKDLAVELFAGGFGGAAMQCGLGRPGGFQIGRRWEKIVNLHRHI